MNTLLAHVRAALSGRAHMASQHEVAAASLLGDDASDRLLESTFLQQLEQVRFAAPRMATAGLAGEHRSRQSAYAVEFADYRSYVPGDDIRLIDWNVYARLGDLCLRLGETQENLRVHLLLDCSASMDWGRPNKLYYAQRVAAALGALALIGYDTVYLGAWHDDLYVASPPLRGRHALTDLLRALQRLTPGRTTDPARAMASYCAAHRGAGIAVLLTDCMAASGYAQALWCLRAAGLHTTLLHILDLQEQRPDLDGLLALHDCETGAIVKVAITPDLLRRYTKHFRAWTDELAALCSAHGAGYMQVSTALPPTQLVLQTLRRQGVLQ